MCLIGLSVIWLEDLVFVVFAYAEEGDALTVFFILFLDLVEDKHYIMNLAHG